MDMDKNLNETTNEEKAESFSTLWKAMVSVALAAGVFSLLLIVASKFGLLSIVAAPKPPTSG